MSKWGAYGILRDSDMHTKQEEFYAWLSEVKGVAMDMCSRREIADYFSSYVEDYNTATMPSEKYYDMRKWCASVVPHSLTHTSRGRVFCFQ